MTRIMVVDDVAPMAEQYAYDLRRLGDFETRVVGDGRAALDALLDEAIDCVLLDLEMPGMDGFEVLRTIRERGQDVPVIVYTGTGDFDRCMQAVRLGASSFIDKSESMHRVVHEIRKALERGRLTLEVQELRALVDTGSPLIGDSRAMEELRAAIRRIAPVPSSVLITGESGTGKELVAREIHELSAGTPAPFVAINSAALPEHLVESELFGHERGAFTGADQLRRGAFEAAEGGTIFLDEIGELPVAAQAKLLRVLEQKEITRVGGTKTIPVSARVVAATHRNLEADIQEGRFRQDLYYRINVHTLHVPPLRERREDIPQLARHFLEVICRRFGLPTKSLSAEAVASLVAYDWQRNNVRELRNIVERLVIAADGAEIGVDLVPPEILGGGSGSGSQGGRPSQSGGQAAGSGPHVTGLRALRAQAERRILLEALERNSWHITRAAQELGLADHSSLLKIMRKHGLKKAK
ncbi:MAG: sigma-54 dependent transcriptional regulator [Gemmatimonadota bacterium]